MDITPDSQSNTSDNLTAQNLFKPHRKIPFIPILGVSITAVVAIGIVIGLMWQSNSFIAKRQDTRLEAKGNATTTVSESASQLALSRRYVNRETVSTSNSSAASASTIFIPGQQYISPIDQRLGLNGSCDMTKKLGLGWTYNWGWMSNADRVAMQPDNVNEIRCYESTRSSANPVNTLITLAKNDGITTDQASYNTAAWSDTDVQLWLTKARNEGKWNNQDEAAYALLTALFSVPTCDIYNTTINTSSPCQSGQKQFFLQRIKANYIQIPFIAARYPGAHYQISNEPDFGYSYMPSLYAQVYSLFYERIKRYDPQAKVAMGSIGLVEFDHPFNELEQTFRKNTGFNWVMAELERKGMVSNSNSNIAWLALVYDEHKRTFGKYPNVDFVAIHPYPWPPNLTNEYLKFVNGNFYSYQWPVAKLERAVADTLAQIDTFKNATQGSPYGYGKKPLWITEINILVNKNPTTQARDEEALLLQKPFMQQLYQQLLTGTKVQKIFWHTGLNPAHQPTSHIESGFVFELPGTTGEFNVLGEELRRHKTLYADSLPPVIASLTPLWTAGSNNNARARKNRGKLEIVATDQASNGQQASGLYRIRYTTFRVTGNTPQIPTDANLWKSVLTISNKTVIDVALGMLAGHTVAVQAEDAYGNVSTASLLALPPANR